MLAKKSCSLPFPVVLNQEYMEEEYFPFIEKYHEYIHDIYFGLNCPPFTEDAMGTCYQSEKYNNFDDYMNILINLQDYYNIPVSATFNNDSVVPSTANLDLFIENFKFYYDKGIRNITLPFMHWMASGKIQEAFPDLYIKNTILNRVKNGQEFWDSAENGYDYVNLDRNLIRDEKSLRDIKLAQKLFKEKTGKHVEISLLLNEGCRGWCPMMDEHYLLSQNRKEVGEYFASERLSDFSCPKWRKEDPAYYLRVAQYINHPSQKEFLEKYVDIYKFHGRQHVNSLKGSMKMISWMADENYDELVPGAGDSLNQYNKKELNTWLKFIKNCKNQCYKCNVCDDLHDTLNYE